MRIRLFIYPVGWLAGLLLSRVTLLCYLLSALVSVAGNLARPHIGHLPWSRLDLIELIPVDLLQIYDT